MEQDDGHSQPSEHSLIALAAEVHGQQKDVGLEEGSQDTRKGVEAELSDRLQMTQKGLL